MLRSGRKPVSMKRFILAAIVVLVICGAALTACKVENAEGSEVYSMIGTFWALLPPLVAIILALITHEVYISLFAGVVVAGLFYANFNPGGALTAIVKDGMIGAVADEGHAGILLFLVLLGIMVILLNKAGGSAAFAEWTMRRIKTRRGALLSTFALSCVIAIDDYFNVLTVGNVMRPVTDTHHISRAKLAYMIDATAAPICMIAPISSWAAAVASYTEGTDFSGLELFVRAIPYNFYSLLTFVFILAITFMKLDYGPMALHEKNAQEKGDLFTTGVSTNRSEEKLEENDKGRVIDLLIPVILLIVLCVFGLVYVGGFFGVDMWGGADYDGDFIGAFSNTDATVGLPWGGLIALVLTMIYLICRRVISFKDAMACVPKGFISMVPAMTILTLAVSLKNMTSALGAADFVHGVMEGAASGLYGMLPAVIFVVACVLAFASGTSWGTFGILIPIVTAIFPAESPLMIIGISACCAGAVCGDHCSPISDTTIMASAGAQVEHVTHVSTQLPYAITVAAISFVCFILAGFIQSVAVCLPIGVVLTVVVLFAIKKITANKQTA